MGSPSRPGSQDGQILKKVGFRLSDFEAQVQAQLQTMSADFEKKLAFVSSAAPARPVDATIPPGADTLAQDVQALKFDTGEIKDLLATTRSDTAHVKRIVLACERDMEDFTAAMDAVNVDLDEMRARVDSTHSIITSRQRVEATVTAEISTMRLDMGDMQEALKAHDAWMEDVSQSLQECHERVGGLGQDILVLRDQIQTKLDNKPDISAWSERNDVLDAACKTVRDMVSTMRLDVDHRKRVTEDGLERTRADLLKLEERTDRRVNELFSKISEEDQILHQRVDNANTAHDSLFSSHTAVSDQVKRAFDKLDASQRSNTEMV